jgi:hypothetical protein
MYFHVLSRSELKVNKLPSVRNGALYTSFISLSFRIDLPLVCQTMHLASICQVGSEACEHD